MDFKSCEMEMQIKVPDNNELMRCHELVQRSNHLILAVNFMIKMISKS